MAFRYQIIYWRDIPAQIKGRVGRKRLSRMLAQRFQVAIDEAAMRANMVGTDDYLQEWRSGDWQEGAGDPEAGLDALVVQLEADYPGSRLRTLMANGGWQPGDES